MDQKISGISERELKRDIQERLQGRKAAQEEECKGVGDGGGEEEEEEGLAEK